MAVAGRSGEFRSISDGAAVPRESCAFGVGQFRAIVCRLGRISPVRPDPPPWLLPYSVAVGVGYTPRDNEEPIPPVRGTNGLSWYTVPDRIIPERGKAAEYGVQPSRKERWNVFNNHESGSSQANDPEVFEPQSRFSAFETFSLARAAKILARLMGSPRK